jgi:transketolase
LDIYSLSVIAQKYNTIMTLEEHQRSGGFGSAIIEALSDLYYENRIENFPFVKRIAIPDRFYSIGGSQEFLRDLARIKLD